jgi:hypothetical protein
MTGALAPFSYLVKKELFKVLASIKACGRDHSNLWVKLAQEK